MKCIFDTLGSTLRIGPFTIDIEVHDETANKEEWGNWTRDKLLITLIKQQPSGVFAVSIVLHEVTHALEDIYGLQKIADEERRVEATATAWTQVYRDNPSLLKWMSNILAVAKR